MYLNSESLDVELITSKSSEMNVMVPKGNGDYTEYPVPEQFKTTISPKGLSTIAPKYLSNSIIEVRVCRATIEGSQRCATN
ncbi:hypothetical protein HZH66_008408 [Vespula vulgaris]|uniref:Adenylate cyclase-associated CAP C-terminal domain-containing protein n=1 Tax=Vespula vulgaris TaxID=7454 RepID=A0A834JR56_VESVU|nr:hypothetical protein HZH66_008408 [Vespula vulgaris]